MGIISIGNYKYGLGVIFSLLKSEYFALLYRKNLHFYNFKSEYFSLLKVLKMELLKRLYLALFL